MVSFTSVDTNSCSRPAWICTPLVLTNSYSRLIWIFVSLFWEIVWQFCFWRARWFHLQVTVRIHVVALPEFVHHLSWQVHIVTLSEFVSLYETLYDILFLTGQIISFTSVDTNLYITCFTNSYSHTIWICITVSDIVRPFSVWWAGCFHL